MTRAEELREYIRSQLDPKLRANIREAVERWIEEEGDNIIKNEENLPKGFSSWLVWSEGSKKLFSHVESSDSYLSKGYINIAHIAGKDIYRGRWE